MKFLDKLERKFAKYAIHNLMTYIVAANVFVFITELVFGPRIISLISFEPSLIMKGQIWRLISFVMIPPEFGRGIFVIFFILIYARFYSWIGRVLEDEMGAFTFNVYYFMAVLATIILGFIFNFSASGYYINLTLFFAFAYFRPDQEILFMFILPIKMKYMAYLSAALLAFNFIASNLNNKIIILASISNFIVFFAGNLLANLRGKQKRVKRKRQYTQGTSAKNIYRHKCEVCNRTEIDNPNLEFRFCSLCDGYHEYCTDHLKNHDHISEP